MSRPAKSSADLGFLAFLAAAALADLPLALVMAGAPAPLPWPGVAALHALAALLMFAAPPREKGWLEPTRHWGEALGLTALLLPGFGWLVGGWLVLAHGDAPFRKDAYRFDEDAEDVNPLGALGTPAAIRRELADALEVLPAADALLGRDPALKRGAIEALTRIRTPEAVAWVFRARIDPDPEVRFYATSALTQLKRDFETAIRAVEREVFRRPGDAGPQLALQRVRYEYAVSGMLDAPARHALLAECRAWLAQAERRGPEAVRLSYLVERQLDPPRALALLERLEALEPQRRARWVRERAALLFELGRHAEVRRLLAARSGELLAEGGASSEDVEWRSAVLWWAP